MNITFKHLTVQNVCGIKEFDTDFYERTIVKGQNATGKSTLVNAFYWVLTDKMADGNSADVKPRDKDGEEIHNLITMVTLTMIIDGKEVRAKKTLTENWVKNKTTQDSVYKGNENTYEINEIPKKKSDFEDYLQQYIDLNTLSFCMNPRVFLNMATKDRRATLFSLIDNSDEMVIATDSRFKEIENDLQDGTVEELIARSKKAITEDKKKLEDIPVRIDEASRSIVVLTEEEREELNGELQMQESELERLDTLKGTIDEIHSRASKAKIRLEEIITSDRINRQKEEADLSLRQQTLTTNITTFNNSLKTASNTVVTAQAQIETHNLAIADYEKGIEAEKNKEFDESKLSCPTCGRKYPDGKQEQIREHFEKEKASKIESLESLIKSTKELIEIEEEKITRANEDIQRTQADLDLLNKELVEVTEKMANREEPKAPTDNAEYLAVSAELAKWQAEAEQYEADNDPSERMKVANRIAEIKLSLGRENTNKAYEDRVKELNEEQLNLSQKIADQERMLDLLTDFQRAKIDLVTDSINKYFNIIKWRFFRQQINGGWAECCEALVDGISLDKTLNHGHKLLAQLDLCQAFQKKAGITVPLVLDDTESIDEWRIPQTDGQLIVLRRTDDKTLTVESLA